MKHTDFLNDLPYFPSAEQIDAASNAAQVAATEYVQRLDEYAIVTVDEGEVKVVSEFDQDLFEDAQVIFDNVFGKIIGDTQDAEMAKSVINNRRLHSIIRDNYDGVTTCCIDDYESYPEGWDPIFKIPYDELTATEKAARRAVINDAFNLY